MTNSAFEVPLDILYFIVPIALAFAGVGVWAFIWSVRSGQYDDMSGPGHRVLIDDADEGQSKHE